MTAHSGVWLGLSDDSASFKGRKQLPSHPGNNYIPPTLTRFLTYFLFLGFGSGVNRVLFSFCPQKTNFPCDRTPSLPMPLFSNLPIKMWRGLLILKENILRVKALLHIIFMMYYSFINVTDSYC